MPRESPLLPVFLVESGERWAELRAVHLTGTAAIVTDPDVLAWVDAAMDAKYRAFRTSRSTMPDDTREHYSVAQSTMEIVPDERVLSWDNARLGITA